MSDGLIGFMLVYIIGLYDEDGSVIEYLRVNYILALSTICCGRRRAAILAHTGNFLSLKTILQKGRHKE